ncbi:MAG: UDP-N-acetylmuramoyl-L-alanyl-D-glutamate--2,6-diaminopimelate ligase [Lentimicrobiaceae bacterium]|nr:UDP-N-acetylmuramoyl-L-alanyl-D-glutamate--2,6-diaminopimelate ligase [Lentimicrobiaceae bacterium]
MPLDDILTGLTILRKVGAPPKEVSTVHFDSRMVISDCVFVAVRGSVVDGHAFIDAAIEKGASVILCEDPPSHPQPQVFYVQVNDSSHALGVSASNLYGNPSRQLQLIGVTGTNGKTTIATLLFQVVRALGKGAGLLSTIQNQINDQVIPTSHTTLDAIHLNQLLAKMVKEKCTYCFMEVSSHGICQGRIAGLTFTGGIFTNLTHDHLDYHKTFREYLLTKKKFFDELPEDAFALTNLDDRNGPVMIQNTRAQCFTYALRHRADFRCKVIENRLEGLQLDIELQRVWFRLIGEFNAYNILAVFGAAVLSGENPPDVLTALSNAAPVTGRFDMISSPDQVTAIIDYAHTPDALLNVLKTLQAIRTGDHKLITVVGAGGDRDTAKRPEMGRIAAEKSDRVILTSDNPRSEDPEEIIRQMLEGVEVRMKRKVVVITNRKEALRTASMMARPGDMILVAGKGHETYQEIKGIKYPFDDRQTMEEIFLTRSPNQN